MGVKTIRALQRGLEVLEALDRRTSATLHDLHLDTDLPKATLLRVLKTLESRGWIHCSLGEGVYRITAALRKIGGEVKRDDEIAELAAPVLDSFCADVMWPSDVAICTGKSMLILETSRRKTPFVINRNVVNIHPHILWSALGRAYLAYCSDEEREEILATLRRRSNPRDRTARQRGWVNQLIEQTRAQGYGVREPGYWIGNADLGGELCAIAVPVIADGDVIASINLLWVAGVMTVEEFAATYLARLRATADALAIRFAASEFMQQKLVGTP